MNILDMLHFGGGKLRMVTTVRGGRLIWVS